MTNLEKAQMFTCSVSSTVYAPDDKEFKATFPDYADVSGVGESMDEAVRKAQENRAAYFDYLELEGKIVEIQESRVKNGPRYSGHLSIRISKRLHRLLAAEAEREGISINTFIIETLAERLGREAPKQSAENSRI